MDKTEQEILQRRLVQFLVKDVFNTITEEDILKREPGKGIIYKGNILTDSQIKAIKKEAEVINKLTTTRILIDEIRFHAKNNLLKAETQADIIAAKLLGYFVDVFESKLKKLLEL